MPETSTIGMRIKTLREKAGLSQEELASRIGVDRSAVAMYEAGKRIPRDGTKILIAQVFDQTVEGIFFRR